MWRGRKLKKRRENGGACEKGFGTLKNQFSGVNSGKIRGARSDAYWRYASERATKKIA